MLPATPLNCLDHVLSQLDLVLLMSVNPGFGGQKFIAYTLDKLRAVRRRIEKSGRGRFRLAVSRALELVEVAAG